MNLQIALPTGLPDTLYSSSINAIITKQYDASTAQISPLAFSRGKTKSYRPHPAAQRKTRVIGEAPL
jgi:hypothetical protein